MLLPSSYGRVRWFYYSATASAFFHICNVCERKNENPFSLHLCAVTTPERVFELLADKFCLRDDLLVAQINEC